MMNKVNKRYFLNNPFNFLNKNEITSKLIKSFKFKNSTSYRQKICRKAGNSRKGSYGKFAKFKASVLNDFVKEKNILNFLKKGFKIFVKKFFMPKNKIIVLTYHQITNKFNPLFHSKGTWTQIDFFVKQMRDLKKRYQIISLKKAIELLIKGDLDHTYVCITFDDGDISLRKIVLILKKLKIPATFFINTAYLKKNKLDWYKIFKYLEGTNQLKKYFDKKTIENIKELRNTRNKKLYRENINKIESLSYVVRKARFVDFDFLRNLDKTFFDVGLHGHEHQRFSMMSKKWQEKCIKKNIEILSKLKNYVPFFAIPFGKKVDWNKETKKISKKNKLHFILSEGNINDSNSFEKGIINRIPADGRTFKNIKMRSFI